MFKTFGFWSGGAPIIPPPTATNVSISGDLFIGETLTGTYTYVGVEPESGSTYQWFRADDAIGTNAVPIGGATSTTYEVVLADVQKFLSFQVTPSDGTRVGAPVNSDYEEIEVLAPTATDVEFTGDLAINELLTATYTYTDPQGYPEDGSVYQWYRANDAGGTGSAPISGADELTYTTVLADVQKFLAFRVTPSNGIVNGTPVTTPYQEIAVLPPTASSVTITGVLENGALQTGNYVYSDPQGYPESGSTYEWWIANDGAGTGAAQIGGATASTYTPTYAQALKYLQFRVTPSNGIEDGNQAVSTWRGPIAYADIIAIAHATSPFVSTYPFDAIAGIGAKLADPVALPTAAGNGVHFNYANNVLMLADDTAGVEAWVFSKATGFSSKFAAPAVPPSANGRALSFHPTDNAVALAVLGSPFIEAWQWNNTTGFGTRFTDPAVLPTGNGFGVAFNPAGTALAVAHATTPFVSAYAWSGGYGSKYADPASLPAGNGTDVVFNDAGSVLLLSHVTTPFVSAYAFNAGSGFGAKFSNPAVLPAGNGNAAAFNPAQTAVAIGTTTSPFLDVYAWNNTTGFGARYSNPGTLPAGNGFGVNWNAGNTALAVAHPNTPFLSVYPWDDTTGIGAKYSNPSSLPTGNGNYVAFPR